MHRVAQYMYVLTTQMQPITTYYTLALYIYTHTSNYYFHLPISEYITSEQ